MSAVTADRPRRIMAAKLMMRGMMLNAIPYGHSWRRHRRGAHEGFNVRTVEAYYVVQEDEAVGLVEGLIKAEKNEGSDLVLHTTPAAASTIRRTLYIGLSLRILGDTTLDEITRIVKDILKALAPGAAIVDTFPVLRFLRKQLDPFKRFADEFHENATQFFLRIAEEGRQR